MEWREVPDFSNYLVSDTGLVWSKPRLRTKGGLMRPLRHQGYLQLHLRRDGVRILTKVHILIAHAFLGPGPSGMAIRHLNGNGEDNRKDNLAYGTQSDNIRDAVRQGTHPKTRITHCPHGHEYTPENTKLRIIDETRAHRICRTCDLARKRKAWAERNVK